MSFAPEPAYRHGQAPITGVLLCNLGTPDAPTASALRRYLGQFLSDPRVVEIPRWLWKPILHGIILRTRPARSAAKYASIWTPEGSPLRVWTDKQAKLLQGYLGERGHHVKVAAAMRYGQPSIASQLDALKAAGATRVLVLPLYPQYSGTTTASVIDAVADWSRSARTMPELRFVNRYHDHPMYIDALAARISRHWMDHGRPDRLVLSFHGVPQRTLTLGDPYHCECHKTGRLLAERLSLRPDQWVLTFQSRFGKAPWLQPYTEPTLIALGRAGVGRVDVACPGFVSDCIETLEEIAIEGKQAFLGAGGKDFQYIPCLNDRHEWIAALSAVAEQHLAGWPTQQAPDASALERQRERAHALGATN
jgi:protoporphyrin/coproporphyrin ferrochelatase